MVGKSGELLGTGANNLKSVCTLTCVKAGSCSAGLGNIDTSLGDMSLFKRKLWGSTKTFIPGGGGSY